MTMAKAIATATKPGVMRRLAPLVLGICGGLLGFAAMKLAMTVPGVRTTLAALGAWDLLFLPVAWLIAITVHELGHLAAGMARGMRFLLLIVGPVKIARRAGGLTLDWVVNLGTLGGLAAAMPDLSRPLLPQMRALVAGGPGASAVLGLACLGLAAVSDGRVAAYSAVVAAISVLVFVATAMPMRAGGFMSDGMQWLELRRGGAAVEQRQALATLVGQSLAGIRPRELDVDTLQRGLALAGTDPVRDISLRYYAYLRDLNAGDIAAASEHIDRLAADVAVFPDGVRQGLALEIAYFHARYRGDAALARQWLEQGKGGVVDASLRALAEAALALRERRPDDALRFIHAGRAQLPRSLDTGAAHRILDALAELQRQVPV
jgi:hypothetical protein